MPGIGVTPGRVGTIALWGGAVTAGATVATQDAQRRKSEFTAHLAGAQARLFAYIQRVLDALVKAGKGFDLLGVPGWVTPTAGTPAPGGCRIFSSAISRGRADRPQQAARQGHWCGTVILRATIGERPGSCRRRIE